MKRNQLLIIPALFLITAMLLFSAGRFVDTGEHKPDRNCLDCHKNFSFGGTIFESGAGEETKSGVPVEFIGPDGHIITPDPSDINGNIYSTLVPDGDYLISLAGLRSLSWHKIPEQGGCNGCHKKGGNADIQRTILLPPYHTSITPGNKCTDCHHFPATMDLAYLKTAGTLYPDAFQPEIPGSQVRIGSVNYSFIPEDHEIITTRPDIFAEGYYSMFDVILAVAKQRQISIEYYYDESRKTHFITQLESIEADYWYHFSYDAGSGNSDEIKYRRQYRWDEALWRPGVWIQLVTGENLEEIKAEYLEEINREASQGAVIPSVRISLNPSDVGGNPEGSGRITVAKRFQNVSVTAHNYRSTAYESPYSKPFQPGVKTSMDILLSLVDQGELTLVTGAFYTRFNENYLDSYYVVEMGFPDEGEAHSSGRQGFVYTTGNGINSKLANTADNKFHMTSDISVIHAPDFSNWRWIELGNPYYENELTSTDELIDEDYQSLGRGFNLHPVFPNPVKTGKGMIRYNIFEPGSVRIELVNMAGERISLLKQEKTETIGIQEMEFSCENLDPGTYLILMKFNDHIQTRKLIIINK